MTESYVIISPSRKCDKKDELKDFENFVLKTLSEEQTSTYHKMVAPATNLSKLIFLQIMFAVNSGYARVNVDINGETDEMEELHYSGMVIKSFHGIYNFVVTDIKAFNDLPVNIMGSNHAMESWRRQGFKVQTLENSKVFVFDPKVLAKFILEQQRNSQRYSKRKRDTVSPTNVAVQPQKSERELPDVIVMKKGVEVPLSPVKKMKPSISNLMLLAIVSTSMDIHGAAADAVSYADSMKIQ